MKINTLLTSLLFAVCAFACAKQGDDQVKSNAVKSKSEQPAVASSAEAEKPTAVAQAPKADAAPAADSAAAKADAAPADDGAAPKADAGGAPYKVSEDGKKVDELTYKGYSTFTSVCVSCHGRDGTGGMGGGANLVTGLKKLSKEDFKETVLNGRAGTLMPPWKAQPGVASNIDGLYAYLKGRSDGKIWPKSLDKMQ